MRAIVRGFAWFLGSLVVAVIVLRATVFDVWTVNDVSRGLAEPPRPGLRAHDAPVSAPPSPDALALGDVVIVLRDSKPSPGDVARCTGADGKTAFALRVAPAPSGSSDPNDLPRPARLAAPRTSPTTHTRRARSGGRTPRVGGAAADPGPTSEPEAPAAANTGSSSRAASPPKTEDATTCRRVVFRLWGEKGPVAPEHRFTFVD